MSWCEDLGELGANDLRLFVAGDPAWMAIIDVARYRTDLPDWDYHSLTAKVLDAMRAAQLVVWGYPQNGVLVRITGSRPSSVPRASMRARLEVTGELFVAGYTAITMAAQFEESEIAHEAAGSFRVPPGSYLVEVQRYFDHQPGEQFADEPFPEDIDHFVVIFERSDQLIAPPDAVPWAWNGQGPG